MWRIIGISCVLHFLAAIATGQLQFVDPNGLLLENELVPTGQLLSAIHRRFLFDYFSIIACLQMYFQEFC